MSCLAHAAQLERERKRIEAAGARIIAVGPGSEAAAGRVKRLFRLSYPVFGDRSGSVYGVFGFRRVLAVIQQSGAVVVDADGVVRYVHRTASMQNSLHLDDILRTLAALGASA